MLGLLHDIGRRAGVTGMRHVLDGYRFLTAVGCEDAARISMTHSFPNRDVREIFGEWDCTPEELAFIEDYLAQVAYDDYDRLIQLCDSLAMAIGFLSDGEAHAGRGVSLRDQCVFPTQVADQIWDQDRFRATHGMFGVQLVARDCRKHVWRRGC